ncbi:MAG: hypothetical protein RLY61_482 [Candidatus Parcubacteria bacterium]|jgi:hypothetical protein
MKNRKIQLLIFIFVSLIVNLSPLRVAFAAPTVGSICSQMNNKDYIDNPPLVGLVCVLVRVFNYGIAAVGAVFVFYFIFAMYKYATSWGDPKGMQAAQGTITNAIKGLVIVIGTITIFTIGGNLLGLKGEYTSFTQNINPFNMLMNAICSFLGVAGIKCD